ncbi:MAG TPA: hypothetical protein VN957_19940 [Chthoniobacterales bacterium]|nr:hypothetical protein [Chthoniobacterales bacterium]
MSRTPSLLNFFPDGRNRRSGPLTATPNAVVAKDNLGATTVSSSTGTGQVGQVFVACDGGEEKLLAERAAGHSWSRGSSGFNYRFSIYEDTDQTTLLASVEVDGVAAKCTAESPPL